MVKEVWNNLDPFRASIRYEETSTKIIKDAVIRWEKSVKEKFKSN